MKIIEAIDSCIPDLADLVRSLIPQIADDDRATDDPDDDDPGICLTVGATMRDDGLTWNYQTGDNSYTGGAYLHAYWAVVYLYRDASPDEIARDIADQLADLMGQ